MFLPPPFRIFVIGLYAFVAWKFLSVGAVLAGSAMLFFVQFRPEALSLAPASALLLYVGVMALNRLRQVMAGSSSGF